MSGARPAGTLVKVVALKPWLWLLTVKGEDQGKVVQRAIRNELKFMKLLAEKYGMKSNSSILCNPIEQ